MARTRQLRCRVTVHLQGGARPGDVVVIDPTDAWMLDKINAGALVPLDKWDPPTAAPTNEPPAGSSAASGDDPKADQGETLSVEPEAAS